MEKNMQGFCNRLKFLRENAGISQAYLAKRLSLTRASVNAWEMGLSVPSTPLIAELANIFHVTTDYLLGVSSNLTIRTDGLTPNEIAAVMAIVDCFLQKDRS